MLSLDRTYEELKLQRRPQTLEFGLVSLDRTYEELKRDQFHGFFIFIYRLDRTYEELKLMKASVYRDMNDEFGSYL